MRSQFVSFYLFAQGVVVAAWWLLLALVPEFRVYFRPTHHPDTALFAFVAADIVCVTAGSFLAAWQVRRRAPRAHATLWFVTGALVYATLYCAAITVTTGEGVLATVLMVPPTLITIAIARRRKVS